MKVIVIGKNGQLARELCLTKPNYLDVIFLGSKDVDIFDTVELLGKLKVFSPKVIINCSAYTAVDRAESDIEAARRVNEVGVANLTQYCKLTGTRLIHVSTDFVFDGVKSVPYLPKDNTNPLGVYGKTKLAGEKIIAEKIPDQSVIVRTSWLYSSFGTNFVKTMLKLMSERDFLGVVSDQVGSPTWAKGLADWIWKIYDKNSQIGIFHWSDLGVASWYDFSVAIQELANQKSILNSSTVITPIHSSEYSMSADRPSYSVLDTSKARSISGVVGIHWRKQLSKMLEELKSYE